MAFLFRKGEPFLQQPAGEVSTGLDFFRSGEPFITPNSIPPAGSGELNTSIAAPTLSGAGKVKVQGSLAATIGVPSLDGTNSTQQSQTRNPVIIS